MRFVVQRVTEAHVKVDGKVIGAIEDGFLVFIGISEFDNQAIADKMIKKLIGLRIFKDDQDKVNLDLRTIGGSLLLISQFTLYADCRKGNRPSFVNAGNPVMAEHLYEYIIAQCKKEIPNVQTGSFGADMKVEIHNDGPFTILLDSDEICGGLPN